MFNTAPHLPVKLDNPAWLTMQINFKIIHSFSEYNAKVAFQMDPFTKDCSQ